MKFKKGELIISAFISILSLCVYLYLFGYADRKIVFLYEHLSLAPFDKMTTGRYWMAGFVLSGFLTVLYLVVQLFLKFVLKSEPMSWKPILKLTAIPLITGVVLIIMTTGEPKLTFVIAISSALALISGTAIGFSVSDDLIENLKSTFIYLFIGVGLVPFLILFRALELPGKGIITVGMSIIVTATLFVGSFCWLLIFYRLFSSHRPGTINVIKGAVLIGYLGLPCLHYLFATPKAIPYITSANNFFAENIVLRLINWILLILIVFLADKLIKRKRPEAKRVFCQKSKHS
jgi:hypothetical protein